MTVTMIAPAAAGSPQPGCPRWCDGTCKDWSEGMHSAPSITVPVTSERNDVPNPTVAVELARADYNGQAGPITVDLYVDTAGTWTPDHTKMTAEQARTLGSALFRAADMADESESLTNLIEAYGSTMATGGTFAGARSVAATSYYDRATAQLAEILRRLGVTR